MTKELLAEKSDLEPLATSLAATFFQRRDLYAKQLEDGSYICIRKPLEISRLVAHLKGEITLGTYVLDPSSQAKFVVFDADDGPQFERVIQLSRDLVKEGVPSYLEESRRGGHLWLFFASPLPGKDARLQPGQVEARCLAWHPEGQAEAEAVTAEGTDTQIKTPRYAASLVPLGRLELPFPKHQGLEGVQPFNV